MELARELLTVSVTEAEIRRGTPLRHEDFGTAEVLDSFPWK
jgi:hypothetical protein